MKSRIFPQRRAWTSVALVSAITLLVGCSSKGLPNDVAKQCVGTMFNGQIYPEDFSLGTLARAVVEEHNAEITWETAPSDAHALRATWSDPLTKLAHEAGLLFEHVPVDPADSACPQGRQVVTRMQLDGEAMPSATAVMAVSNIVTHWRQKLAASGVDPYSVEPEWMRPQSRQATNSKDHPAVKVVQDVGAPQQEKCAPNEIQAGPNGGFICKQDDRTSPDNRNSIYLKSHEDNGRLKLTPIAQAVWAFSVSVSASNGGDGQAEGHFTLVDNKGEYSEVESGCQLSFERRTDTDWHVEQLSPGCSGMGVSLTGDYKS